MKKEQEHIMRKVIRGYAKDKDLNLILIGTIPVPHSKGKRSPVARQDKRYLVRQGATIFKKETIRLVASYKRAARADCAAGAAGGRQRRDGTTTFFTAAQNVRFGGKADIHCRHSRPFRCATLSRYHACSAHSVRRRGARSCRGLTNPAARGGRDRGDRPTSKNICAAARTGCAD